MNQNLLIIGSGRLGAAAQEIAQEMDCFKQIEYLDIQDITEKQKPISQIKDISDLRLRLSQLEALAVTYRYGIAAVESSELRLRINQKLESCCYTIPTLLHPFTSISCYASIGKGCIIEPGVIIEGESRIGDMVILRAGSMVGSYTLIGEGSSLDVRSVILEGCVIAPETVVKAGAVMMGMAEKDRTKRKEEQVC